MVVAEKLGTARKLLEQAQRAPEGERIWLLTLAFSQLQEGAEALEYACGDGTTGIDRTASPPRTRRAPALAGR